MTAATDGTRIEKAVTLFSLPALRNVFLVYLLFALAAVAYWPASAALYENWTDFKNLGDTQGFLVLAISLWLVFRSRRSLAGAGEHPSVVALAGLLLCSFAWLILWRAGLQDPHLLLIPAILWLSVFAASGRKVAITLALPIGYLYFAWPGWSHLAPVLQAMTTHAVGLLASAFGLPVYIEGNTVGIPEGTFDIEGGCSGIHFFVVGIALAVLQGELMGASRRRRVQLIAVMAGLAIMCNWLRVFTIVMAGHLTHMQHFLIRQHYTFGWVLFGVVVGTYIWISAKPEPSAGPLAETGSAMASRAPKAVAFLAATSAMLMAPILGLLLESGDARAAAPIKVVFPVGNAGWSGPVAISDPDWRPEFLGADAVEQVAYHDDGGNSIEVAAIVYRHQEQGAELIGDSASLLGEGQWKAMSEEIVSSQAGKFRELMAADRQGRRLLIRYRYDIGGQQFVEPLLSQMWYGVRSLRGAPYSALVAYGAACSASCEEARNMIDTFLGQMARNVEASLPQRSR